MRQIKIEGLFLDYDGTISALNVNRQESRVPEETQGILFRIRQRIPLGIITTKDLSFILPRTPFAHAWAAMAGLEIKSGDKVVKAPEAQKGLPYISLALAYAKHWGESLWFIEEKQDSIGQTVAFCVDWRNSRNPKEAETQAIKLLNYYETLPITVIRYQGQPFFDVYPCNLDKGKALTDLKLELGLKGNVMYLGDSKVDNSAFRVADISIGVLHEESTTDLDCEYLLKFEDVANFLKYLLGNNLVFHNNLPFMAIRRG